MLGTSRTKCCHLLQTWAEGPWGWGKPSSRGLSLGSATQRNVGSPEEPPGSFHLISFVSGLLCK